LVDKENIMALEKIIVVDQIEVVENGCVQVRTATKIVEDGKELSRTLHRHVVSPGDDYSGEDARVQGICAAVHTPEIIAAYQAIVAANRAQLINEAG
jgi:hypothetical protein